MPVRLSKFGFRPRDMQQPESRISIFDPTLGYDGGQAPQELPPGYTPESQNWEEDGGNIVPRSGLSAFSFNGSFLGPIVYASEFFDLTGSRYAWAVFARSLHNSTMPFLRPDSSEWTFMTGDDSTLLATNAEPTTGWQGAQIYEPARDMNIAVITGGVHTPLVLNIDASTTSYSAFTHAYSQFSTARSIAESDYRLVWFNVSSLLTSYPTRVVWSGRGLPLTYTVADGAGFEDLLDMRGVGLKVIADPDGVVLFSDQEIWRGRRRQDAYAFDFYRISDQGTPFPRSITRTPHGITYLGRDRELYLLSGDQPIALGPDRRTDARHSRIQKKLRQELTNGDLAFGVYNSQLQRNELYYTSNETNTNLYPKNRMDYNFDSGSIFFSKYSHELTAAFETTDVDTDVLTWDEIPFQWDDYGEIWDDALLGAPQRRIFAWSHYTNAQGSLASVFISRSEKTTDDGTAIDARWRSHGLGQAEAFRYDQLSEVQVEYASGTSSSVSLWLSGNGGASFSDSFGRTLSATSHGAACLPCNVTASSPMFELRINDGSTPRISRLQAKLFDGGVYGGAS